jgi:hypothetical protein
LICHPAIILAGRRVRSTETGPSIPAILPIGIKTTCIDLRTPNSIARYIFILIQDSANPKCTAIPGYGGYIPYVKPENIHGKGYTPIAKQSFSQDKLAKNILGLSSTGFNLNKDALIDHSKFGSTSKYGRTAIQRPHPGWNVNLILFRKER